MSKVAIVATDSGSLQEVVGNGGWLVREADPPRLAAVLRRLARPQEQLATARRGYERALSEYVPSVVARRAEAYWASVLSAV